MPECLEYLGPWAMPAQLPGVVDRMPDGTGNPQSPLTGHLLADRYRLDEPIEAGTSGEVWSARDTVLNRPVAVKLINQDHADDEEFVSRFRAESRSAAALSHSGVAKVFDYGEQEGTSLPCPYLVMESVSGRPLSALIAERGALPADMVLDITAQAAQALNAAHNIGITHRDLRPGKLLVTDDGRVKVTDFGIATVTDTSQVTTAVDPDPVRAATYLAPEQASGGEPTPASDIYSLGVVAYECLTGSLPFAAETLPELAAARAEGEPEALPATIQAPVQELVMRMLAREPGTRPASALAVAGRAGAIRTQILSATGAGAQQPGARSRPGAPPRPGAPWAATGSASRQPGPAFRRPQAPSGSQPSASSGTQPSASSGTQPSAAPGFQSPTPSGWPSSPPSGAPSPAQSSSPPPSPSGAPPPTQTSPPPPGPSGAPPPTQTSPPPPGPSAAPPPAPTGARSPAVSGARAEGLAGTTAAEPAGTVAVPDRAPGVWSGAPAVRDASAVMPAGADPAGTTVAEPLARDVEPWDTNPQPWAPVPAEPPASGPLPDGSRRHRRSTVAVAAAIASAAALVGAVAALLFVGNPGKINKPPQGGQSPGPHAVQGIVPAMPTSHPSTLQPPKQAGGVPAAPAAPAAASPAPRRSASSSPSHSATPSPRPSASGSKPPSSPPAPPPATPPSTSPPATP
jgi:serine/threonine-protein kinase